MLIRFRTLGLLVQDIRMRGQQSFCMAEAGCLYPPPHHFVLHLLSFLLFSFVLFIY